MIKIFGIPLLKMHIMYTYRHGPDSIYEMDLQKMDLSDDGYLIYLDQVGDVDKKMSDKRLSALKVNEEDPIFPNIFDKLMTIFKPASFGQKSNLSQ